MNEDKVTNLDVALIMKSALDYNAQVIHIATIFYGNMGSKRNQEKLKKNMKDLTDAYMKELEKIYVKYEQG